MHLCGHSSVEFFFGHVMLGLVVHCLYFSQPSVSKICSFINSCIHPSLFWVSEKTFTAFTLQAYTNFFFQKLVMISEFFSKKSWKLSLFTSMFFSQTTFDFYYFLFFFLLFVFLLALFIYFGYRLIVNQLRLTSIVMFKVMSFLSVFI